MFSGFFGRSAPRPPPIDEPSAIPVREALDQMGQELMMFDKTLGKQFAVFNNLRRDFTDKVRQDKLTFNSVRAQRMPGNDLNSPLEEEALGITPAEGGSMYYGHGYGSKKKSMKKHHDAMFDFSSRYGIPKYI